MKNKKLILNTYSSLANQIIVIVCGLILPRVFLQFYGSEINGLITSITQFINFISFMELGVGAVVQSALYKPLAEHNNDKVSMIIKSADNFFKKILKIFMIYLCAIIVIYPIFINQNYGYIYICSLILILSISLFAQYYFGLVNQLLVVADQRAYISYFINGLTTIGNTLVSMFLIYHFNSNIHIVKLFSSLIYLIRPIFLYYYVKKNYKLDKNIKIIGEPIKQKWSGMTQHISAIVLANTDSIILSVFSTLSNVSIYSIYYMIVNSINNIINSLTVGFQSLLGQLIVTKKLDEANELFTRFELIMHSIITVFFTCTGILIVSFVKLYTLNIDDANYIQPLFSALLTIGQAFFCIRTTYYCVIKAAGHYQETQVSAVIEMLLNIIISIIFVINYGIIGVTIGTLVAILYRTIYCVIYASRRILHRPIKKFIRQCTLDLLISSLTIITMHFVNINAYTYFSWFIKSIICFIICSFTFLIVNVIFNKKELISLIYGGKFN